MRMDFDLSHTSAIGEATLLPPGAYEVVIQNCELKQNRDGENYLNLWYQVQGPSHTGAVVFERLNLWSQNPTRVEISLKHLKGIREACNLNANVAGDTDELISKRMYVKVGIREYNGSEYQEYRAYKPVAAAAAQAAVQAAAPRPAAPAAPASGMPW